MITRVLYFFLPIGPMLEKSISSAFYLKAKKNPREKLRYIFLKLTVNGEIREVLPYNRVRQGYFTLTFPQNSLLTGKAVRENLIHDELVIL